MFMSICFPPILYHAARLVEDAPGQIQRAAFAVSAFRLDQIVQDHQKP
jgi:hypothetical protein